MAVAAKPALTSKFFPFSPPKTRSPPTKLKPHFKKSKIIVSALLTSHQSDSSAEEAPLFSQNGKVSSGTENNPFLKMGLKPSKTRVFDDSVFERVTVKDYMDRSKDLIKHDGGPPRWFSPIECGRHLENAPLMLFLPGIEGVGLGLLLHHQRLGKIFDVWCLHIPVQDRTPFEGLVEFVERTVKSETSRSPNRPIYLVGDSFGGCLALSVAARNPDIDLILILVNPATSFNKLQLQPLFQLLEFVPDELHVTIPYFLSFITGDPVRMAMANVDEGLPLKQTIEKLSETLTTMLPCLSGLADILPKKSLLWKLRMLRSASSFANSRLHAIKAQTLILASGKDQLLPSQEEAKRLCAVLPNSRIRHFKDSGHSILLEGGINLATIIKGAGYYRRSRHMDFVSDYQPPTFTEFQQAYQSYGWVDHVTSPVVLSTLEDGKIVRGLAGIPHEGPIMLVGYHMLMGWEVTPLVREFLIERDILVRGVAHPFMFDRASELLLPDSSSFDPYRLMGAVPVSATNLFKLLSRKSFVLLYPGGAREALHRKGEGYKLFWPEQSEFVRMAARFGATIIPFGVVGVDDICELVLDYDDLMRIPFIKAQIEEINHDAVRLRTEFIGELGNQALHLPGFLPKFPGRFYFLFSKPIETKGRKKDLRNKEIAHALYLDLKSQVEKNIAYLREKREKDPYRNLLPRLIYQATHGFTSKIPTFEL